MSVSPCNPPPPSRQFDARMALGLRLLYLTLHEVLTLATKMAALQNFRSYEYEKNLINATCTCMYFVAVLVKESHKSGLNLIRLRCTPLLKNLCYTIVADHDSSSDDTINRYMQVFILVPITVICIFQHGQTKSVVYLLQNSFC